MLLKFGAFKNRNLSNISIAPIAFFCFLLLFIFDCFSVVRLGIAGQVNGLVAKEALKYADARMWKKAYSFADDPNTPNLINLLDWLRLRAGDGTTEEYIKFLNEKADWPGLPYLAEIGEQKLAYDEDPNKVLSYFKDTFPSTGHGSLVLAKALMELGKTQDSEKVAKISWLDQEFTEKDFFLMIENFGNVLSQTHHVRLENLLWNKERKSVLQMSAVIPEKEFLLAKTRLELQAPTKNSLKSVKLPKEYWQDPGAILDLAHYLQDKNKFQEVSKILDTVSKSSRALGKPGKWKKLRVSHSRRALRLGKAKTAYNLASNHFIEPSNFTNTTTDQLREDYVELEWFSGFIALNFLEKPKIAEKHFARIINLARKKVNVSKAYYWYGRTLAKLNRPKESKAAFLVGSGLASTFYGQLSAERIKKKTVSLNFISDDELTCREKTILKDEIVKVGILLLNAERIVLGVRFFKHAAETMEMGDRICLLKLLNALENWSGVISVAKKFIINDEIMFRYSYPVLDLIQVESDFRLPLVYAIIRQESEFYSGARSRTGALGLMQIMPKTAMYLAKRLGFKYEKERMLKDEIYNIRLGASYIDEMLRLFQGSTVLSLAAYNAGPGSVKRWIKRYGDPRSKGVDPLVWIEMIPYNETRNYVKRVLANELVYRAVLDKSDLRFDRAQKNFGHRF